MGKTIDIQDVGQVMRLSERRVAEREQIIASAVINVDTNLEGDENERMMMRHQLSVCVRDERGVGVME